MKKINVGYMIQLMSCSIYDSYHIPFFFIFIVINMTSDNLPFSPLKVYSSVGLSTFTILYKYDNYPFPELFHYLKQ